LESPDFISLDRNGPTMSISSSIAPRATFDIDGRARTERTPYGGVVTVRASFYGDQLVVATTGNRGSDFTVTFEPMDGGRTLRITRRVDASGLADMVEAQSFYNRTADQPRWELYVAPAPPPASSRNSYLVEEGTVLVGRLDTGLGNRTSHQGDRFSMTVDSPAQFRGAVIDGLVAKVNGSNRPGRSDLLFDFDRIRLRDGRTSAFEGFLREVRTPDGTTVPIDVEGVARTGQAPSGDPVQRGALGATFGAIIGAIAGGGKGAVIGAVVGGSAGAGSVFIEGRDLNLPRGTEVTVIARTPWDNR
jgi:hypothetical protein